jgi:hypothetical protein
MIKAHLPTSLAFRTGMALLAVSIVCIPALAGMNYQGMNYQGMNYQGMNYQGMNYQGMNYQGMNYQGMNYQGMNYQGMNYQGMNYQGMNYQGMPLGGLDRGRTLDESLQLRGISRADVALPSHNLQGLQPATPFNYVEIAAPMSGVRLQASPTDASPGSYVFVPGLAGTPGDITGSFWNIVLSDSCTNNSQCPAAATCTAGACIQACTSDPQCGPPAKCALGSCSNVGGGIALYISDVAKDAQHNLSKYSSNEDIYLYTVYYREAATGHWTALCPTDLYGENHAMAIPVNPNDWSSDASRAKFTFACTASGVAAKCARIWGYKPWKTVSETVWDRTTQSFVNDSINLGPFYDACLIAARADYCQDDHSYTKNGTLVDLFDTLDGISSLNSTSGSAYAPYAPGVMLHEEYQISVDHRVSDRYSATELASLSSDERGLVERLHLSGLESSRYADLDPGRACAAAPYIDRCDPSEPYSCYRAANMSTQPYGAFLAVNSPQHCSHDEATGGEPLDPLCNECVHRVCQIDPTCCGDPGNTFYPGSLVWDGRCSALRQQVCRSAPGEAVWPTGVTATPAGSRPVTFLRGAIGAFEGIVTEGGVRYAEGWACDPDYPGASSSVQLSVGGALGAAGATLYTTTADQPLIPGWRETVAAECGGAGRHGFRFALPAGSDGRDVFVYGIDLDVPGAPFSLLRGGKKTVPGGAAPAVPGAAIWTGWLEPASSGSYTFSVQAGTPDKYRVWANGIYVAGNWVDSDPNAPGAFTLPAPATPPSLYLQTGVRYGMRVEYLRNAADSGFALKWSRNGAAAAAIPTTALVPMAQGAGNGLQGTYFPGGHFSGTGASGGSASPADSSSTLTRTFAAVDHVWTDANQPISGSSAVVTGASINNSFAARFEGQVVPPISGTYTFTADTDGVAKIWVNGQLVTSGSTAPPGLEPDTCAHDVCQVGRAVTSTCKQGYFCAARICLTDPTCCSVTWDAQCVQEVASICQLDCTPTPPFSMSLSAGRKYDIVVEYEHVGGTTAAPVRGGKLRLMWALEGSPRDVIPRERLFAATGAAAPATGVGLNAAYFSDGTFANEVLDHVDPTLAFDAASPPTDARATSLICGPASAPACTAGTDAPGAPALVSPSGGAVVGPVVAVKVAGLARGATVTFFDGPAALSTTATAAADAGDAGQLTVNLTLANGSHRISARQTVGSTSSAFSNEIAFDVVSASDPLAPPAPTVTQPVTGLVTGSASLPIAGTAAPGATVTVTAKSPAGTTTLTLSANAAGAFSGVLALPGPGSYDVTLTDSAGGHTSASSAPLSVKVSLSALTLSAPASGGSLASPVTISGTGADATLGDVILADGDGKYFAERGLATPSSAGAFSGALTLDYGRHVLKAFQRARGLDGDGATVAVLVPPPVAGLAISSPASGAIVDAKLTVSGTGGLRRPADRALAGSVKVYQGNALVGQGPLADDGTFAVPVVLTGAGSQSLSISQLASSLSGGGAAESARAAPRSIKVRPAAPVITAPASGAAQTPLLVAIAGRGYANASVTIAVDAATVTTVSSDANGRFVASATLTAGTHRLTAVQSVDGVSGPVSAPVVIAVGDVTPPVLTAPRELVAVATDASGADVDFASQVTATDDSVALPAAAIACAPSSGARFALGSTNVTCEAVDAGGNRGRTSLLVTVKVIEEPLINGANLTAEAQGPLGAVVNYAPSATGFVADCSPPGSGQVRPCKTWKPAGKGLGFTPDTLSQDPITGALYAAMRPRLKGSSSTYNFPLFKSTDQGETWQQVDSSGLTVFDQLVFGGESRGVMYAPIARYPLSRLNNINGGLRASSDGGRSWTTALDGVSLFPATTVDPADPLHIYAVPVVKANWATGLDPLASAEGPALYETHDGWKTWSDIVEGLPAKQVISLAVDPLNPGRLYAGILPDPGEAMQTILYRKVGQAPWERLSVPAYPIAANSDAEVLAVAPALEPGQTFPTVFTSGVYSRDGGETWLPIPGTYGLRGFAFDTTETSAGHPYVVLAVTDQLVPVGSNPYSLGTFMKSADGGATWKIQGGTGLGDGIQHMGSGLVQDHTDPKTFFVLGLSGVYRTRDQGLTWTQLPAPEVTGLLGDAVKDLAVDPVDPAVAYLLATDGVYKTTDGGDAWKRLGTQMDTRGFTVDSGRLRVDPSHRNTVYLGGGNNYLWKTLDGGASWGEVAYGGVGHGIHAYAIDPLTGAALIASTSGTPFTSILLTVMTDTSKKQLPIPVVPSAGTTSGDAYRFQIGVGRDGRRTAVVSWYGMPVAQGTGEVTAFTLSGSATASQVSDVLQTGLGLNDATLDSSLGTPSLLTTARPGQANGELARYSLPDLARQELAASPSGIAYFDPLRIDPLSGGQVMVTVSDDEGTLWDSGDAGRTWQKDDGAPGVVTGAWLSPVDGAVYASVFYYPAYDPTAFFLTASRSKSGQLWKRTLASGTPPGARVAEGDLRVTCNGPDPQRASTPGSVFPVGVSVVTCTATDAFGNTATRDLTITVRDTKPPAIAVPATPPTASAPAGGKAAVTFTVTASDLVDGTVPVTCVPASGSQFSIGVTTVSCSATDTHGNGATTSFPVLVSQTGSTLAAPTLTVPSDLSVEATGPTGAPATFQVTALDHASAPLTPSCDATSGSTFALGRTKVTCSATEGAFTITKSFAIVVSDLTAPTLTVPSAMTVSAQGSWGAAVTYAATASDLVDGAVTPACVPASGSTFPIGATDVSCGALDQAGNQAVAHFAVTVRDVNAPVLHLTDISVDATDFTGTRVDYRSQVSATDVEDPNVPVTCLPPANTLFAPGETQVSCSATDSAGHVSTGSFTVSVSDLSKPAVTVPGPITVEAAGPAGAPVTFEVTATDAFDGALVGSRAPTCARVSTFALPVPVASGATFPIGDSLITCSASDLAGNAGTASFTVVVRDTTPPTPSLPAAITATADASGTAVVAFTATGTDTVGGVIPAACQPKSGSRFSVGTTVVACTVTDAARNQSAGSFQVTVKPAGSPLGQACGAAKDCASGFCVDGVCCNSACGGGAGNDCQACAVAGGGNTDGICGAVSAGRVCRPGAGACDLAESCDGTSTACPADALAPAGTTCRASAGACDVAEACSGASAACPADAFRPATTTCRAAAGACDVAETCSGSAAACPVDAFRPAGTVCGPAGACQNPGVCGGNIADCPAPTQIAGCVVDTTPPVFGAAPDIVAYATSTSGVKVTYALPPATDAVDGPRPVTCTPASGSTFAVNKTTVTCTASDTHGNGASKTFTVWVQYQAPADGTFFLVPVRADGSSIFKIGRPVPARFKLTGASAGITNLTAKLTVTKISNSVQGTIVDTSDETVDDTDFIFKYRSLLKFYAYRWKTTGQSQGTYLLKAELGDGVAHQINVSLKP